MLSFKIKFSQVHFLPHPPKIPPSLPLNITPLNSSLTFTVSKALQYDILFLFLLFNFHFQLFLNNWYVLTASIYSHQLSISQETFEIFQLLRKLILKVACYHFILKHLFSQFFFSLELFFRLDQLLKPSKLVKKNEATRKQLCVLGTHPNLFPEVIGNR